MANWQEAHKQDLESGEVYFQEASEVTLPRGYRVVWITYEQTIQAEHKHRRPEMKIKDTHEDDPKVFSGLFSGVGLHRFSRFSWWMISHPIDVTPGLITRAKAQVMVISHGIEGDASRPGACGMRVGIVDAGAINLLDDDLSLSREDAERLAKSLNWDRASAEVTPHIIRADKSKDIAWSKWWVVRGSLDNENVWKSLQSDQPPPEDFPQPPPFVPTSNQVRLILQCNADVAASVSAGHYDDLIVEQDLDSASAAGVPRDVEPVVPNVDPNANPGGPSAPDRTALIDAALALQAQAKMLLEMDPPMVAAALELQKQAGILLQMVK